MYDTKRTKSGDRVVPLISSLANEIIILINFALHGHDATTNSYFDNT